MKHERDRIALYRRKVLQLNPPNIGELLSDNQKLLAYFEEPVVAGEPIGKDIMLYYKLEHDADRIQALELEAQGLRLMNDNLKEEKRGLKLEIRTLHERIESYEKMRKELAYYKRQVKELEQLQNASHWF